jgi:fused signal recognition particle receptor
MLGKWFRKKSDRLAEDIANEVSEAENASIVLDSPRAEGSQSWSERLKEGLSRTRGGWVSGISSLFSGGSFTEENLERFEELLLEGDLGIEVTTAITDELRDCANKGEIQVESDVEKILSRIIQDEFSDSVTQMNLDQSPLSVILMVGINGVGKTTTTAKLAHLFHSLGKKTLLVAADTFRAGATEQLEVWASRIGCEVVVGKEGQDPASVAYDGIQVAKEKGIDLLLVDTAGRLHTQEGLMQEAGKISRVIAKNIEGAPHETLMVLDATTGQNAIAQARQFHKQLNLSGLVMTKLDGTARGGSMLAIHRDLKLPVRFIGVGEALMDLRTFNPGEFTEALFSGTQG